MRLSIDKRNAMYLVRSGICDNVKLCTHSCTRVWMLRLGHVYW